MSRNRNSHFRRRRDSQRKGHERQTIKKYYPLPKKISNFLEKLSINFNFGLYFNKWLPVYQKNNSLSYEFQTIKAEEILKKYNDGIRPALQSFLRQKHEDIDNLFQAFEALGYKPLINNSYPLETSLIIGLGNVHPTERGFTFHWTLGIPYIPAESIKGVVRLAYLVEKAREDPNFFELWAKEDEKFWEYLAKPFGRAEKENGAERGKVIFLDAFPVEVPELTLEITTCHYPNYYSRKCDPTEDQNPNPLPFLAVSPGSKFRFILLAHESLKNDKERLVKAFRAALTEHGFGAKTALGHGRFSRNA